MNASEQAPRTADTVVAGLVQTPEGVFRRGGVVIEDGVVTAVVAGDDLATAVSTAEGARLIDVGDSYVLPGAVDAHVHSYSHGGEGLKASTSAAAAPALMTWATTRLTVYAPAIWVIFGCLCCLASTPALFRQITHATRHEA